MKFMKLGSKPDSFQNDENNIWYVASELATDIVINIGDAKFYLHKFPLLSKSARLQKLVASTNDGIGNGDEIDIHDIPVAIPKLLTGDFIRVAQRSSFARFYKYETVTLNAYTMSGDFEAGGNEIQEMRKPTGGILSEASKLMVAKLVDSYLAEVAKDPNLPLPMFMELAETVSGFSRPAHDGIYRAIDMYLKAHLGISKNERKKIHRLMDCKKLSMEAYMHAVESERLPLRVVVQVLFFEQVRAAASSGSNTPNLPKPLKDLNSASDGSSRTTTTNTEEDWDAVASAEELRTLRGELASLRLERSDGHAKSPLADRDPDNKVKGLLATDRIFKKNWPNKGGGTAENSGSDSSGSLGSGNHPEEFQLSGARRQLSWRQFILALGLHTEEEMESPGFARYWSESKRMIPRKGDLHDYWRDISTDGDFLGSPPSYTLIRDLILRLCHQMMAHNIARKSQAPEKVTVTDLFYLRGLDVGSVNIPYLLARYLRRLTAGRKSGAHISGGHFVARLAEHFRLLTAEILGGLTVIVLELQIIDMVELVRLQIYVQLDDTWAWVAM
ncbi:BTB/POZ domain-containing protein NPY2 [Tanacetum coccineum]